MSTNALKFPENFFWGTATSAHQIEGDNTHNDWWEVEQRGLVPHKSGRACDSYNRYEEDFDLAKTMHNNAHRFSIEWSRVEPEKGKFSEEALEHYRKVLGVLRARGLEPFVTLHHFTNPIWFARDGGWTNKKAPARFARYAKKIAEYFSGEVRYWVTINEPILVTHDGYMQGKFPPFRKRDYIGYWKALANMVQAHKNAYEILHQHNVKAQVGIANATNYFELAGPIQFLSFFLYAFVKKAKNEWFFDRIKNYQDFLGINYYNHFKVSFPRGLYQDGKERSNFGWEIHPEGIYHVAREMYQKYNKPIFITENGISDANDDQRPEFIKNHLTWLQKAIEEGTDVRGYFHWSLLDNFEWAEGFTQRFGLVEVDFSTFERKMRPSGKFYGGICQQSVLT